jgi:hypothetical protein
MKNAKTGWACSTHGWGEIRDLYKSLLSKMEGSDHLEDAGLNGTILLNGC